MYRLDDRQREALIAALKAVAEGTLPAPTPRAGRRPDHDGASNCYACHLRDGRGGVEEARQEFFKTTQQEMGDEGRIPPSLDGVGAKLRADYMKRYFDVGVKDRPYMLTRMPRFGAANLEPLIAAFAALDPARARRWSRRSPSRPAASSRSAGSWPAARRWGASSATPSRESSRRGSRPSTWRS